MTAFLFIPSTTGAGPGRRVNLADIASLFSEIEPPPVRRGRPSVMRIVLAVLILLAVIGDTLLVTRSETLAGCFASGQAGRPPASARS